MGKLGMKAKKKLNQVVCNFGRPLPFPDLDDPSHITLVDLDGPASPIVDLDFVTDLAIGGPTEVINAALIPHLNQVTHVLVLPACDGRFDHPTLSNLGLACPHASVGQECFQCHLSIDLPKPAKLVDTEMQTDPCGLVGPLYDTCWHVF